MTENFNELVREFTAMRNDMQFMATVIQSKKDKVDLGEIVPMMLEIDSKQARVLAALLKCLGESIDDS